MWWICDELVVGMEIFEVSMRFGAQLNSNGFLFFGFHNVKQCKVGGRIVIGPSKKTLLSKFESCVVQAKDLTMVFSCVMIDNK